MTKLDLDSLMAFASETAVAAGKITLQGFERVAVEFKADGSEVTEADRASEEFIRNVIRERFPDHGVFGEEGANVASGAQYRWIVDPIDGTRSFASGVPLYGVLLALEKDGAPVVGCAHFPALDETIVAATGAGCWRGETRATVSACDNLAAARVISSGLEYWRDWATAEGKAGFNRLIEKTRFTRTWGDCFGYVLIATGRAEVLADPACGAYWDYAPMLPIISEAGGRFTTLSNGPISAWSTALATNGLLHSAAAGLWDSSRGDAGLQVPSIVQRHST